MNRTRTGSSSLRVAIDARPLSHPQAGGYRSYVRGLVRGLAERAAAGSDATPGVIPLLLVDRPLTPEWRASLPPDATVRVLSPDRLRADFVLLPRALRDLGADLVHGTQNYLPPGVDAPSTVTIHDAFGIRRWPWDTHVARTPRERFIHAYWKSMTRLSARRARKVVTISQASADDLAAYLPLPRERITVVYNCSSALPPPEPPPARSHDTVLAIASPDPRKNLTALYRAVSILAATGCPVNLAVVCASESLAARTEAELRTHGIGRCRLVVAPDDRALACEYASAACLAFPSWREGFGAPPLEAMSSGCPVAASDAPALPEVLGDAALYFSPYHPDACADAIRPIITVPGLRDALGAAGRAQAARYSPRRMAEETARLWGETLAAG